MVETEEKEKEREDREGQRERRDARMINLTKIGVIEESNEDN